MRVQVIPRGQNCVEEAAEREMFAGCGLEQVARGGGDTPQTERPWKDYCTKHPSQRRNSRKSKTDPNALALKLKPHTESLWMDRSNHTSCPQDMLRRCGTTEEPRSMTATHTAHEELHNWRTDGVWKMLSLDEALSSLEEGLQPQPSVHDIAFLLHKCRKERNQVSALRLHAYMLKSGLEAHPSLGNCLVLMLVEVGSMCHAQQVFDRLLLRDLCSWNSLILGYVKHGESRHALILYQKMQEDDSVHPSPYVFVALLKACAELNDLKRGCKIHADIARKQVLERHIGVGSALVSMYAKCSSLAKAQEVFDRLPVRNVVSWNSLIAGYAKHGQGEQALKCFEQMQHEGVPPNGVTFVCSLMACGSIGAADKGQEIHAEIARKGLLQRDLRVGNALISMYAKCGLLTKAHEVLDKLSAQDVVSWNALIAGYAQHERGEEALKCFEQMQHLGISPDAVTFVCSLKACGSIGALKKGREIHAEISRKGLLERDLVLGSTLVDMYAKCGSLAKAREVFDKLPARNIVTWNALIAGYAQHGHGEEAVTCFELLKREGVSPDSITFICSLKACGSIGATGKGEEIHAEIARKGLLERDIAVGNTLVDMYAKCGSLVKAQEVFDKLPVRDVVSWNALMSGYVENGCFKEALNIFEQMKHDGFSLDTVTFVCSLKACGSIQATDRGQEIHAKIARKGLLEKDRVVGNALIDMYVKCGFLAKAQEVLVRLPVRDVISWTALIMGYAEHGCGEDALDCFEQMQQEGVSPNALTFVCSLKACGTIGATDTGRDIHAEIARKGLLDTDIVGSALIDMYAKCGWLEEAQQVFDLLPVRDVVSWTGLMAGYAQLGESENVFHVFDKMVGEGIKPNLVTFISVLNACSHTGLIDEGQAYFEAMSKDYGIIPTIEHHTCMFDLLGRAGQLEKAVVMIKRISLHPDLVVWHTVLSACRKWGNVELGRQAFEHVLRLDEMDPAAYVCMYNIYADVMQDEETKFEANESGKTIMEEARILLVN